MDKSQSIFTDFRNLPLKLIKIWSIAISVFWLVYDVLAFFVTEDPLPTQGLVLCVLGNLAVVSLLLVFVRLKLAGLLTTLFALSAMVSLVFYNWSSAGLIVFGLVLFILPLLIPGLFVLLFPGLFTGVKMSGMDQAIQTRERFYQLALYALMSLLIIGMLFVGVVVR